MRLILNRIVSFISMVSTTTVSRTMEYKKQKSTKEDVYKRPFLCISSLKWLVKYHLNRYKRITSLCIVFLSTPLYLFSASFTWNGGGGDNNLTTAANWVGGVAPSGNANEDLIFTGTTRTTPSNNFPSGTSFNSISLSGVFGSGADFTLSGNDITLIGGTIAIVNGAGTAGVGGFDLTLNYYGL